MDNSAHKSFQADDRSYYSIIKKEVHKIVADAGFDEKRTAEADIIISELTSNLNKHADGGEILVKASSKLQEDYIEIICLDNGPGISDLNKVLSDGYSSLNTLGHGLGSIKRMADQFDMYSLKDWGTIVLARVYKEPRSHKQVKQKIEFSGVVVPKKGETFSGDGYYMQQTSKGFRLLVADGLGHGEDANIAVHEAVKAFKICPDEDAVEILKFIHRQIKKTRGIVGTVILYDEKANTWRMAGIGNISTKFMDGIVSKMHMSYNGIIGHNIPNTMKQHEWKGERNQQFICCSDGIKTRWDLAKFPSLHKHDLSITAAVIYKEFGRQTDDMSVIITKLT